MIIKDLGVVSEPSGQRHHRVIIQCEVCKKERETRASRVNDCMNICKSCQVIARNTTHGLWNHPLRGVHNTMKQRCTNPNAISYPAYGARGISVCKEWHQLKPFYDWAMANGYKEGLTIDRIDNDGNYEPSNCQWITLKENQQKEAKIQPKDRQDIIKLYLDSIVKVKDIATMFNIDKSRIYQILKEENIKKRRILKCITR